MTIGSAKMFILCAHGATLPGYVDVVHTSRGKPEDTASSEVGKSPLR
jgi:hypothetical protein